MATWDLQFAKITARAEMVTCYHLPSRMFRRQHTCPATVHIHQGSGSCFHFCPRPCVSTCRWARLATHRHIGPHFVCISCSHAHLARATTACVSSPRDWAVSIGSHMQHDIDMSKGPPHLGALFPVFDTVHVRKRRSPKMAISSPETPLSFVSVATRFFRPAGRHCTTNKNIRHVSILTRTAL